MSPLLRALLLAWMPSGHWLFSSSFYQICPWLLQLRHKDRPDKKQHGSLVIIYPSTRCKNMIHDGRGSFLGKSRFNWSAGVEELLTMFYKKEVFNETSVSGAKEVRKGWTADMHFCYTASHSTLGQSVFYLPLQTRELWGNSTRSLPESRHMITNLQILNVILFSPGDWRPTQLTST